MNNDIVVSGLESINTKLLWIIIIISGSLFAFFGFIAYVIGLFRGGT